MSAPLNKMSTEAHITIYCAQTNSDDLFNRFKTIDIGDSVFINHFIDEGFNPTIDTERRCQSGFKETDGWVLLDGEDELRDDWEEIEFDKVKVAIRFGTPENMTRQEFKPLVKEYFESFLSNKQVSEKIGKLLKPIGGKQEALVSSITGIGDPLPDGRRVITIAGGIFEDRVRERLKGLDPSILQPMEICY
jgi:hypothetical protein